MYKDAREELKRLEEALLEEEEPQEEELQEETEEEDVTLLLEDIKGFLGEDEEATIPHVYNTDRTDTDLDSYSEEVHSGQKQSLTGLVILAVALALGIVAIVVWWVIRYGGVLL